MVRDRIAARRILPGARLASIRGLARQLNVSASTVTDAYERLVADGIIRSRPGAGFYAVERPTPFSLAATGPRLDREVDPVWMSRQSLETDDGVPKPGCGWLPPDWMPRAEIQRSVRRVVSRSSSELVLYGAPAGHVSLRQRLSRILGDRGIEASPDQIVLTESGTQALDLLCRLLIEPGDTVLVDDPCYFNFRAMLRAHRARVVGVPYTPSGPDLEALSRVLAEHEPRLYITNSALHNPTGASLAPAVAHRVLALAERHDLVVIEDDIFGDFEDDPAPRLAGLDGLDRVVHIGSFSKTLSASIRCGYVALRADWVDGLIDLKLATSFAGGAFGALVVERLLADGSYRRHMSGVRGRLTELRGRVGERLSRLGLRPWTEPRGGMFLWCRLPDGVDAAHVARSALAGGVVLAPGNAFSPAGTGARFMRFNVAQMSASDAFDAVGVAMDDARRSPQR